MVTNTGTGQLWAIANPPENPVFTIGSLPAQILGPNESYTLKILFSPAAVGSQQGTLRIGDKTIVLRGAALGIDAPSLQAPTSVDFGDVEAGKSKDTMLVVKNTGNAALTINSLTPTGAGFSVVTAAPLTVQPGFLGQITLRITGGAAGAASGRLTIGSNDPTLSSASVNLTARVVTGALPATTPASVLNGASFKGGGIAPGELVTIFGANMGPATLAALRLDQGRVATELNGTRVLFDGVPAPIIYTLAGQGSVLVPYSVAGQHSTEMVVEYQGRRSAAVILPVVAAAPGLFSANSSGSGPGAILNQNGTLNSAQNQAATGSVVVIYGTGEGSVTPGVADGAVNATVFPKPVLPMTVTIGGRAARVQDSRLGKMCTSSSANTPEPVRSTGTRCCDFS